MVTFSSLLAALYEIQEASDPNNPIDDGVQRLEEIFTLASEQLAAAGYQPD